MFATLTDNQEFALIFAIGAGLLGVGFLFGRWYQGTKDDPGPP